MKRNIKFEKISKSKLHKIAKICRSISYSIINDVNMIKQYNTLAVAERKEIREEMGNMDIVDKSDVSDIPDSGFLLQVVDIHIISGKHNIDPAVACLTIILKQNRQYFIE